MGMMLNRRRVMGKKGYKIVWNQLTTYQNSKLAGITLSNNSDSTITISSGTPQFNANFYSGLSRIKGHIYLFKFNNLSGTKLNMQIYIASEWSKSSYNINTMLIAKSGGFAYEAVRISLNTSNPILEDSIIGMNTYDLTQMFGAGNEPTTIKQFEYWLDDNIGTADYYPYNKGEEMVVKHLPSEYPTT